MRTKVLGAKVVALGGQCAGAGPLRFLNRESFSGSEKSWRSEGIPHALRHWILILRTPRPRRTARRRRARRGGGEREGRGGWEGSRCALRVFWSVLKLQLPLCVGSSALRAVRRDCPVCGGSGAARGPPSSMGLRIRAHGGPLPLARWVREGCVSNRARSFRMFSFGVPGCERGAMNRLESPRHACRMRVSIRLLWSASPVPRSWLGASPGNCHASSGDE